MVTQIAKPLNQSLERAAWGPLLQQKIWRMRWNCINRKRERPKKIFDGSIWRSRPLHASRLAKEIGIPKVIIPFAAGLGSAIGLLGST